MSIKREKSRIAKIRDILKDRKAKIHFVGIRGSGMLPLAELLRDRGYSVTGSDIRGEPFIDGIAISSGHYSENVKGRDLLVYSFAIPETCEELQEAYRLGIPFVTRAELLGAIMEDYLCPIGVMGTHGKSTSTAMLSEIFSLAELSPTVICGARLPTGSGLLSGDSGVLIYEACEYRDAFLSFSPIASLVLSVELDHIDYFHGTDSLITSFLSALGTSSIIALNIDDPGCHTIYSLLGERAISFGASADCDYRYRIEKSDANGSLVYVSYGGGSSSFYLPILGEAAVIDAVGAFALSHSLGVKDSIICNSLAGFYGIERRLELIATVNGRRVYYDYAHHPTEIRASISALRQRESKLTIVFRPHTFSRTEGLFEGFVSSLSLADNVIILDVFSAREDNIWGRGSRELAEALDADLLTQEDAFEYLLRATDGAIVLMGAGDISQLKGLLLEHSDIS